MYFHTCFHGVFEFKYIHFISWTSFLSPSRNNEWVLKINNLPPAIALREFTGLNGNLLVSGFRLVALSKDCIELQWYNITMCITIGIFVFYSLFSIVWTDTCQHVWILIYKHWTWWHSFVVWLKQVESDINSNYVLITCNLFYSKSTASFWHICVENKTVWLLKHFFFHFIMVFWLFWSIGLYDQY